MQQYKKILGKVMLTPEGTYDNNKIYEPISLVTDEETGKSYISRKEVPAGIQINNREYWQPVASSGIIDNGVIILNRKNSDGQIPVYDLKSATEAVAANDRKGGVILGFLGFNPEIDTVPTWKLYQYNDVSPSNWTNIDYWLSMDYTNKYAGWFDNEEALYDSVPFPKVGMYAYVGNSATSAIIYRCYVDRTWQATEDKAFGGVVNLADEEDITSKQNKLKFKDKEYNPAQYNGMGRIYLRKNIVDGKNILTQTMMQATNTIYIIQYDYDLNGEEITIYEGCVLDFQGGSFSNGTIIGNNTMIKTFEKCIFKNCNITNVFFENNILNPIYFGAVYDGESDDSIFINKAIECSNINDTIVINKNIRLDNPIVLNKQVSLNILSNVFCYNTDGIIIGDNDNAVAPNIYVHSISGKLKNENWGIDDINARYNNSAIKIQNGAVGQIKFDSISFFEAGIDLSPLYDLINDIRKSAAENRIYGGTIQRCKYGVIIRYSGIGTEEANESKRGWAEGNTIDASIFGCDFGLYIEENALATYTQVKGVIDCMAGMTGSASSTSYDIYSNIETGIYADMYFVRANKIYDKNFSKSYYNFLPYHKKLNTSENILLNPFFKIKDKTQSGKIASWFANETNIEQYDDYIKVVYNGPSDPYFQAKINSKYYKEITNNGYLTLRFGCVCVSSVNPIIKAILFYNDSISGELKSINSRYYNVNTGSESDFRDITITFNFPNNINITKIFIRFIGIPTNVYYFNYASAFIGIKANNFINIDHVNMTNLPEGNLGDIGDILVNTYPERINFYGWMYADGNWHPFGNKIIGDTTGNRPKNPIMALPYFDTTLNKPIWWNGSKWVDATGANV